MAELTIRPEEIRDAIERNVEAYTPETAREEVGRVLETGPDPEDASRVRLVLVTVLGPPPGDDPDQREMVLSCPRDMNFGTAIPHNLDRQLRALRRAVDRLEARKPRHSSWRVPLDRSSRCLDHQTGSTHPERARSRS